ncbi:hypothetical protein TNCV_2338481 [Trichonephila clavipes]|nr:hypothetical protein TNCV_2338481 [Trichonephila clavipes]
MSACVVTKTHFQCQQDKAIYSRPDGEQDTVPELGSDVPAYCLQVPMEWDCSEESRVQICHAHQSEELLRSSVLSLRGSHNSRTKGEEFCRLVKDGGLESAEKREGGINGQNENFSAMKGCEL